MNTVWERGGIPADFRQLNDDDIWWPRNDQAVMTRIAEKSGWEVESPDLNLVGRDSIIKLRRPV